MNASSGSTGMEGGGKGLEETAAHPSHCLLQAVVWNICKLMYEDGTTRQGRKICSRELSSVQLHGFLDWCA